MKEQLRETCTSISPKYGHGEKEPYVITSRKEMSPGLWELTVTEDRGLGYALQMWFRKGTWQGLDFLIVKSPSRAGRGQAASLSATWLWHYVLPLRCEANALFRGERKQSLRYAQKQQIFGKSVLRVPLSTGIRCSTLLSVLSTQVTYH